MTFEEFFAKKKIDTERFAKADPSLYAEFKSHFALMGEKSFDHTKKFWFNKLRHLYHLEVPAKAITQLETQIASQAEPLNSPTIEQKTVAETTEKTIATHQAGQGAASGVKPAGFKPRFKPRTVPEKTEEPREEAAGQPAPAQDEESKPAVKKPPFKPRSVRPAENKIAEDASDPDSRPGTNETIHTPVLNAGTEQPPVENAEKPKPAYKPRFNIKNISKNPAGAEEQTGSTIEKQSFPEGQTGTETGQRETEAGEEAKATEKPAYKPRFKMKNAPQRTSEMPETSSDAREGTPEDERQAASDSTVVNARHDEEKAKGTDTHNDSSEEKPKPAYKPRFNMKNIKPKE